MDIKTALARIIHRQDLTATEMTSLMRFIMTGNATAAQIGGFLIGLHTKGETVEEVASAAKLIRSMALRVDVKYPNLIDIVGTGGDRSHTFNISTTSAFVAAAAGAKVAKHNNRAISSKSGSMDVLEIAGVNFHLTPEQIAQTINQIGIGFMFAPHHHLSWRHVTEVRRELGVRTLFNLLGVLVNPAFVTRQVVGVYSTHWIKIFIETFKELGSEHTLVVHSEDGLDEISIAAPTIVGELKNGVTNIYTIESEQLGIKKSDIDLIRVVSPEQSYDLMQQALNNQPGPARDIVALNAGAAIYTAGLTATLQDGVNKALAVIASGAAKAKLNEFINFTQIFK